MNLLPYEKKVVKPALSRYKGISSISDDLVVTGCGKKKATPRFDPVSDGNVTTVNEYWLSWLPPPACFDWLWEKVSVDLLKFLQLSSDWLVENLTLAMAAFSERVKGFLYVILLFLSASLGFIFMQAPFIPLLFFAPILYKDIMNFMISVWLLLPPSLNRLLFGTRVRMFGSQGQLPEKGWNLILMNHRTRLDWFYFWMTFLNCQGNAMAVTRVFKIVLKSSLRHLPGFGWAMQVSRFLFLDRNWEKDKKHLTNSILNMANQGEPHSILIFPEGTDMEPKSLASSHSFAKKNNLPLYQHVLHPRVTGTVHAMKTMIAARSLERVVNVTVYYPDFVPSSEFSLLHGDTPVEIWYFLDYVPVDRVPGALQLDQGENNNEEGSNTDELMADFIKEIWARKEAMLDTLHNDFIQHAVKHASQGDTNSVMDNTNTDSNINGYTTNINGPSTLNYSPASENWPEITLPERGSSFQYFIIAYWVILCMSTVYLIVTSFIVKCYVCMVTLGVIFVALKYGGLDKLEVNLFNSLYMCKNV